LELEDSHYYVGISQDVEARIEAHMNGNGAKWTQLHPPLRVIDTQEVEDKSDQKRIEKAATLELMRQAGWRNVRGYAWTARNLSQKPGPLRD